MRKQNPRVMLVCPVCANQYQANPQRLKHGRQTTCSRRCSYQLRSQKTQKQEAQTCLNCGCEFTIAKSRKADHKGAGKYCSRTCRDQHRIGMNHPQFINGTAWDHRGANWQAQRRKALRRDGYKCQTCGISQSELVDGQALHVHHIRPYRLSESYLQANDLSNLKTLCGQCHRTEEAELQRGDRHD